MSDSPSETSSASNSTKPINTNDTSEKSPFTGSSTSQDFTETPQSTAEQTVSTPVIVITNPHTPSSESTPRQSRSVLLRHQSTGTLSSLQSPSQQGSSRPSDRLQRSHSQPLEATSNNTTNTMSSSASSPSGTSTAGSNSGSGQGYQLPYAPFPYPMPAQPRGGQQQGGQGK
ncbi:hypothetical protein COCC4DRAFT_152611 [Bipolaris maydis ATCC 48331]|uniref:Uncharacterized protein n=3 Tax=Cochliobolus heterostrophus TaxID=5016 RepID=M2V3G0_COCH5|nr:uncharacterized protein COCC4DRAFT_152611 [Bipolaris maydis ATCC 48331]EMD94558.1 hypothetical protein COCHEDRAFT_1128128 [Bipolaris maydis C5]KAH7556247.1 hypothetical protein BM1_06773 [Bipolaris maydis]ENH99643.1 hypothetical protein COCC4DRAFT_152611 [Bipolaris maydis ATCC 48331]KAJ5040738.1 hypothetical protein J3E74DRAFT_296577 [Bipolaris maydis]KAJ6215261.1 hypothetical protein PSV09DRAFT_1128128 [Bipolaris maydis]